MSEIKVITEKNNKRGIKRLGLRLAAQESLGWKVKSKIVVGKGFNTKKGCCWGFLFLPLMVFGISNGQIEVTLEKENVIS